MWANVAAAAGDEDARDLRQAIPLFMSEEEIASAQMRAKDCVENDYKGC